MHPIIPPPFRAALLAGACLAAVAPAQAGIVWSPLMEPGSGGRIASLAVDPNNSNHVLIGGDMLGVGVSTNATSGAVTWSRGEGMTSWECGEFTFDPYDSTGNTILLGTMGGPYQSTDGGMTWSSIRSGVMPAAATDQFTAPIQKIVILNNGTTALAFGGSHRRWKGGSTSTTKWGVVWESIRSTTSSPWGPWSHLTTIGSGTTANILSVALTTDGMLFAVVDTQGVFKSTNQGANWTALNSGLPNSGTLANGIICQGKNVYLAVSDTSGTTAGIYNITSTGTAWTAVNSGLPTTGDYQWVAVSSGNNALYTSDNDSSSNKGVWKATPSGSSWAWSRVLTTADTQTNHFAFIGGGPAMDYLAVDPGHGQNVYAGNGCYVAQSTNFGASGSWTDVTSGFLTGSSTTYYGTGYVGLCSRNVKFNPLLPAGTRQTVLCAMDDGKYWSSAAALSAGGIEQWTNGFAGSTPMPHFDGARDVSFSGATGQTIYVAAGQASPYGDTFQGILKSTDGGATWPALASSGTHLPQFPSLGDAKTACVGVYADSNSPYTDLFSIVQYWPNPTSTGAQSYFFHSGNGGTSWGTGSTLQGGSPLVNEPLLNCMASRSQSGSGNHPTTPFYIGGSLGVYKVNSSFVASWLGGAGTSGTPPKNVVWMVTAPNNVQNVYAVDGDPGSSGGGIYKWTNTTSTWTLIHAAGANETIASVDVDPNDTNRIIYCDGATPSADLTWAGGVFLSTNGDAGPFTAQNTGVWMLRASTVRFDPFDGTPSLIVLGLNGGGFLIGQ